MDFDIDIHQNPGRKHIVVDAISRLPTAQPNKSNINDYIPTYEASKVHAIKDKKDDINVEPLTIHSKKNICIAVSWPKMPMLQPVINSRTSPAFKTHLTRRYHTKRCPNVVTSKRVDP